MKQVHVGFIGAGSFISITHLPTAAKSDFIRIRAISDLNPEVLAAHRERYNPDGGVTDSGNISAARL